MMTPDWPPCRLRSEKPMPRNERKRWCVGRGKGCAVTVRACQRCKRREPRQAATVRYAPGCKQITDAAR